MTGAKSVFSFYIGCASPQVVLNNYKTIDKPFAYKFLHPWLGTGLLTATGKTLIVHSSEA
jgi:hypothetical protein